MMVVWIDEKGIFKPKYLIDGNTVVNGAYEIKFKEIDSEMFITHKKFRKRIEKVTRPNCDGDYNEILSNARYDDTEMFYFDGNWSTNENTNRVVFEAIKGTLETLAVFPSGSFSEEILGTELREIREDTVFAICEILPEYDKKYKVEMFTKVTQDYSGDYDTEIWFELIVSEPKKKEKHEIAF